MVISADAYQSPLARGRFGIKVGFDLAASKSCSLTQEASDCHTSVLTRLYMLKVKLELGGSCDPLQLHAPPIAKKRR